MRNNRGSAAWLLIFLFVLAGCGEAPPSEQQTRAQALAERLIVVDTHIDVPYRLFETPADVSVATADGNFDYPRAVDGGLDAAFMSIYVPARYESNGARAFADEMIDGVEAIIAAAPQKFAAARTVDDVRRNAGAGLISLPLGMENGAPLEGDLANLEHFAGRGIRYITLAHSASNHIADSSFDSRRPWRGLSPFGEQVVGEMNRLGVMIDVSHISDEAFREVIELSAVPVIASHSSARHFTPGFERNMSDDLLRMLAANGGVIQLNFGSAFLTPEGSAWLEVFRAQIALFAAEHGYAEDSEDVKIFRDGWLVEHPVPRAELADVLDHIDHVVEIAGIDHVGLGSDFDGVGDTLPSGLADVSDYPNLIAGLLERGYSETDIEKIVGGNLLRVWSAVEAYAASRAAAASD